MSALVRELQQAIRRMARSPALAMAAILCTALGVGVVSAGWIAVDAVLLRPLSYVDPDRLVVLWERALDGSAERIVVSPANFGDWRERTVQRGQRGSFERLAAFNVWFPGLTGVERPEKLLGAMVSADFFPVLGARPLLGRTLLPEDDRPGAAPVVVLGHGLWRSRFGGDREVLGRAIELDGVPHTVVGVMPEGFRHPEPLYLDETTALWKPLALDTSEPARAQRFLRVVGKLPPGVPLSRAQAEMDEVARRLAREHPAENEG
ncbi:MAG TPA: ABC transporter permease, partial [Thermoanaerobaculia bacterium]|nr:ABC transporter permease [Thermoanaerobaculia bacterium]